ncbi:uncharacterized protein METZ01_LOCUS492410, partial [marine metagenome]
WHLSKTKTCFGVSAPTFSDGTAL